MSRVESYWVDLLDKDDQLVRRLDNIGGSVTMNVNRQIRGGGKINVLGGDEIDWVSSRVRCWFESDRVSAFPLGTFIPTFPSIDKGGLELKQSVSLQDKMQILVDDKANETFSLEEGTIVTDAIRDIILSTGQTRMSITPSDAVLTSARSWEVDTTKLRIINDLLDYINYFSIWADGFGIFQVLPYTRPADRPVARVFQRGVPGQTIHLTNWTRNEDLSEIPNRVVALTEGGEESEAMRGEATNTNPDSRFYFENMGRWVQKTVETEASDQQTLDDFARRRLIELTSVSSTLEIQHLVHPLQLNDVVRFISDGVDTLAVVERMDFKMQPGSLVKAVWREVQDI